MRCERCPIVTLPGLVSEFTCLCGAKFGPGNQPTPVRPNVVHHGPRLIDWAAKRYQTCRGCEHRRGDRCGMLIDVGKPGILLNPKGVPNPAAACPDGRWVSRNIQREVQSKIESIVAVTSVYPNNVERQSECLRSWRDFGLSIASCNSVEELPAVKLWAVWQ